MNEILLQTPSKYVFLPLIEASLLLCCPSLINWKHIITNENSDRGEVETCFSVMNLQPKHKKQFCLCRKSNPLLLHYPIDLKTFTSPLLTSCQQKFHNRSGTPLQVHLKRSSVKILFLPLSFVHRISWAFIAHSRLSWFITNNSNWVYKREEAVQWAEEVCIMLPV